MHGSLKVPYCMMLPVDACRFSVYLYLVYYSDPMRKTHPREPNKNLGVNCARTFGAKDCGSVWDAVLLTKTAKYGGYEQSRNLIALFACIKINDLIHTASSSSIFN